MIELIFTITTMSLAACFFSEIYSDFKVGRMIFQADMRWVKKHWIDAQRRTKAMNITPSYMKHNSGSSPG